MADPRVQEPEKGMKVITLTVAACVAFAVIGVTALAVMLLADATTVVLEMVTRMMEVLR
jgi:hypothetical protein